MFDNPVRIAMWSGPRNLSTAMMRSFGARPDTVCVDEPFYAAYLDIAGLDHPMREDILAGHPTDPDAVALAMSAAPAAAPVFYQKQMTHHMVDGVPRGWMSEVRHAFLIRHPARVLASYAKKMEAVSLEAIGFAQQKELFDLVSDMNGERPVVIDSDAILHDPAGQLKGLCEGLGIGFDEAMLSWAPGPRAEDGVWAPHWYDAVFRSTGFGTVRDALPELPAEYDAILEPALAIYDQLARHQIG